MSRSARFAAPLLAGREAAIRRRPLTGRAAGLVACLNAAFAAAGLGITRAQVQAAVSDGALALLPLLARLAAARRVPALPGETPPPAPPPSAP